MSGCATEQTDTPFTMRASRGQVLRLPIAHGEGNYFADPDGSTGSSRPAGRPPLLRPGGQVTDAANPNGSLNTSPASATKPATSSA